MCFACVIIPEEKRITLNKLKKPYKSTVINNFKIVSNTHLRAHYLQPYRCSPNILVLSTNDERFPGPQ